MNGCRPACPCSMGRRTGLELHTWIWWCRGPWHCQQPHGSNHCQRHCENPWWAEASMLRVRDWGVIAGSLKCHLGVIMVSLKCSLSLNGNWVGCHSNMRQCELTIWVFTNLAVLRKCAFVSDNGGMRWVSPVVVSSTWVRDFAWGIRRFGDSQCTFSKICHPHGWWTLFNVEFACQHSLLFYPFKNPLVG